MEGLIPTEDTALRIVVIERVRGIVIIKKIQDLTDITPTPIVPMKSRMNLPDVIVIETVIIPIVTIVEVYRRRKICERIIGGAQSPRGGRNFARKIETTLISGDVDEKDRHHLLHLILMPFPKSAKMALRKINDPPGRKTRMRSQQGPTNPNHQTPTPWNPS